MVYAEHFAAVIISFVYPAHWLLSIWCLCLTAVLVPLLALVAHPS
jgi:branched-subunit amino acid permease